MNVTIAANLVNVYLNAGFIYGRSGIIEFFDIFVDGAFRWASLGWAWLPFPAWGVKGAATATMLASVWLMLHYTIYLFAPEIRKRFRTLFLRFDLTMLKRQMWLAAPQAAQEFLAMGGFVIFFKIVGKIGTAELASTEVIFSIMSASFMPAAGVGQAGATLVGKFLGEQRPDKAETSIFESIRWSLMIMDTMGIVFLLVPHWILPIFTNDPAVIAAGIIGLRVLALAQFADAVGITAWFSLTGAGNTIYPAVVEIIVVWGVFLPMSYITGVLFGWGSWGAWLSFGVYIFLFAGLMTRKILQNDWKTIIV